MLGEYEHWVVLLRPEQVTAGCMVLACKEDAERMPDVSPEAFAELSKVTGDLETCLKRTFDFAKINYLLFMMVDRHVHWHVVPRYDGPREAVGVAFNDPGWPRHPRMGELVSLSEEQFQGLHGLLSRNWPHG